jgi:imidazolonepropionase-like amidohydrolase
MKHALIIVALLVPLVAVGHDYPPAPPQAKPILLRGGDLYTVSDGVLEQTDLLFEAGRITAIGKNLNVPTDAVIIDIAGKRVYPGLIDAATVVGLTEIGAVRATSDTREVGRIHPEVKAHIAYNTDSEIIPTVRAAGVTTVLVAPQGGTLAGRSALINLDGWTWEDAAEKLNVAVHVNWPRERIISAWWMEETPEEQRENNARNREQLFEAFEAAESYYMAKSADPGIDVDTRWEAMLPVFTGEMPVFARADDYGQIEQAVSFFRKRGIRVVLVGGRESWRLTDLLKQNQIPVILGQTHAMPASEDAAYDSPFSLPDKLADAGIAFCISSAFSATGVRNLAFQAGQAVAFGLEPETALRAITLSTAEILGVADNLGSLAVGKKATLFVSEGDILDPLTAKVTRVFIEGRNVNLDSKHEELYRKYRLRLTPSP